MDPEGPYIEHPVTGLAVVVAAGSSRQSVSHVGPHIMEPEGPYIEHPVVAV
jgi:hypothetical protein